MNRPFLQGGYRLIASLRRVPVEIAIGSFLIWIVALDDRVRELNEEGHASAAVTSPGAAIMARLKLARNGLAHSVTPISVPGGFRVPMAVPLEIHPVRWVSLDQLTEDWTPKPSAHLPTQIQVVEEQLAERPTVPSLQSAFDWVGSFAN